MWSMHMSLSYGVVRHFGMGRCAAQQIVSVAKGLASDDRTWLRIGPVPVLDMNRIIAMVLACGLMSTSTRAFSDPPPTVRLSPSIRSAAPAQSAAEAGPVYVYPAGCYDRAGRPVNVDPTNPERSADPACQPPSGTVVRGRPSLPGDGQGTMEPGSINRPSLPVPVPDGIGVMR